MVDLVGGVDLIGRVDLAGWVIISVGGSDLVHNAFILYTGTIRTHT